MSQAAIPAGQSSRRKFGRSLGAAAATGCSRLSNRCEPQRDRTAAVPATRAGDLRFGIPRSRRGGPVGQFGWALQAAKDRQGTAPVKPFAASGSPLGGGPSCPERNRCSAPPSPAGTAAPTVVLTDRPEKAAGHAGKQEPDHQK